MAMPSIRTLVLIVVALALVVLLFPVLRSVVMPGQSYSGPLPPISSTQQEIASGLRPHVERLAGDIGERNTQHPKALESAAQYIETELKSLGYVSKRQVFVASGQQVANIETEVQGTATPNEIVIVGAHYDSVFGTPGANDNGSGVAAVLEVARLFRGKALGRTVRYVFFVNEEPPYFQGEQMGSLVYAKRCRDRKEKIVAMYSLETIGYYSDRPGSQQYPSGLGAVYPDRGDFISIVGNEASAGLLRESVTAFRDTVHFPSIGAAVPESIPGAGWSDHWSFWKQGYPGIMLTDTAPYRYPHYHLGTDTPDKLNYEATARVVDGFSGILKIIAARQ